MADGSSGNLSGILFEAGKTISDAGKQQAQATANAVVSSVTGSQKPLFNATSQQKPLSGSFTPAPKPLGGPMGQLPKLDTFGKMFGSEKPGFGAKQTPQFPQQQQFTQADLDKMAADNKAVDDQEIAKRQAELAAMQQASQAHKQLHDEVYYKQIEKVGEHSIQEARDEKTREEEAAAANQPEQNPLDDAANPIMAKNAQLGQPQNVAVQQATTKTEANRGATG